MVKTGQLPPIAQVPFDNPKLAGLGLETLTIAELRRRAPPAHLTRHFRTEFHSLVLYTSGKCAHNVDFVSYPVRPRTLISLRPLQVQQFHLRPSVHGRLLLLEPRELPAGARLPVWSELPASLAAECHRVFDRVARETASYSGDPITAALLRHSVSALLLELTRFTGPAELPSQLLRQFDLELEQHYHQRWTVLQFARRLGYSEKTLTRACQLVRGQSAKDLIDARIALEAQRLLAHGDWTVAAIASHLGFTEPTNFVKFFHRAAGLSPARFRARYR